MVLGRKSGLFYKMSTVKKYKYGRTFHLPWSLGRSDDDKVHSEERIEKMFAGREVVITEKLDGENTTIYHDGTTHARSLDSVFHASRSWVKAKAAEIATLGLSEGWRLLGENLYAKHAISYDRLPDYFMLFGISDERNTALPWHVVEEWAEMLEVPVVPILYRGMWNKEATQKLFPFVSSIGSHSPEGYVVRLADEFPMNDFRFSVAKFVRENHVGKTSKHWMSEDVIPNKTIG